MDYKARVVDVALATSAAPTYLPAHKSPDGIPFLDGGLWANNPTGMAVVDAISMLNVGRDNIEVLSLGCTRAPKNFAKLGSKGELAWARGAIDAAISGQSFSSLGTAYQLLGNDHVERIDVDVEPGRFELDGTNHLDELCGHGFEKAGMRYPSCALVSLSKSRGRSSHFIKPDNTVTAAAITTLPIPAAFALNLSWADGNQSGDLPCVRLNTRL